MSSSGLLPGSLSHGALLTACVTPAAIAGLFVMIRVANSFKVAGKWYLDDWLAILGLVVTSALAALSYYGVTLPNDPNTPITTIPRVFTALQWVSPGALHLGKMPLLVMTLRIFEVSKWVRWNVYIIAVVPAVLFAAGAIYATERCSVVGEDVTQEFVLQCMTSGITVGVWNGAVAVVSDMMILAMPIPVIWKLNLAMNKKVGLLLLFLTGLFTLVTSGVTLYYKASSLAGQSNNVIGSMIGALLEAVIALVVSCLPAIRSLWLSNVINSALYMSIKSKISLQSWKTQGNHKSYNNKPDPSGQSSSAEALHAYIELPGQGTKQSAEESTARVV